LESGLKDLGYIPGTSVVIDCRSGGGEYEGLPLAAAELAKLNVDVIVAAGQPTAQAAHDATQTIPIVMIASGDPVAAGLVKSLAHPGGNVTGLTYYATELTAKRLELLREAVPSLTKIGVLANPAVSYLPFEKDTLKAGTALGLGARLFYPCDTWCGLDLKLGRGFVAIFGSSFGPSAAHPVARAERDGFRPRASFKTLWARQTRPHSAATFSTPRSRN
jgi:putative ABC transport system substrate-binding protein